jgi:hypothetical protein
MMTPWAASVLADKRAIFPIWDGERLKRLMRAILAATILVTCAMPAYARYPDRELA